MAAATTAVAAALAAELRPPRRQTASRSANDADITRSIVADERAADASKATTSAAATTALTAGLATGAPAKRGGGGGGGGGSGGGGGGGGGGGMASGDQVAVWEVPLHDGLHSVEFEHGTTSGKRVLRVDGNEVLRRDWMFKLVGDEEFVVGGARCVLRVQPVGNFSYSYELLVNGRPLDVHTDLMNRATKIWTVHIGDCSYRVVFERDTLDVWANGKKLETMGEFVEDGTETHFTLGETPVYIKAVTSGKRREGLVHSLVVGDVVIGSLSV